MRFVMFYHSLRSDWNHGNAHFLRGVASNLLARGYDVDIYEPADAWSTVNLAAEHGPTALDGYRSAYPTLDTHLYDGQNLDLHRVLAHADVVLVHEWNDHDLVARIGRHHAAHPTYQLLFHDTHHRAATDPAGMARYDLRHYDGVLAYGAAIRDRYLANGWTRRAFVWHEAADTRVFRPLPSGDRQGDLVWIGNWGDDERTAELQEFLINPVRDLGLHARIYGVRYPYEAQVALSRAGISYRGWLPNYEAPAVFAGFRVTVHVPRRPYVAALPGVPTIRVFEALACGIPLVSAPWDDAEHLFTPGEDFLVARDGAEMRAHLRSILNDPELASSLARHGLETVRSRHTCRHRVDELLEIVNELARATPVRPRVHISPTSSMSIQA
jgi:spore maturation protein CgeB